MHKVVEPKILYFGTPVVLISTLNEDGTPNLAPMSSAWWLGQSCMLGMSTRSKTVNNLRKTGECVLNLPSPNRVDAVDKLALTTGSNPVPDYKVKMGYRYRPDKFAVADLTPVASDIVYPPRVAECSVQLEAQVIEIHPFGPPQAHLAGIELQIVRVHIDEAILVPGKQDHIDPNKWKPIIMNFAEFFTLGEQIYPSRLAEVFRPKEVCVE